MKAAIVNFTGGRENWGSQATSDEMLRFCSDVVTGRGPAEIVLVPLLPKHALDVVIEWLHGKRIKSIYATASPQSTDLRFLNRLVELRFGELVERVRTSDIVFFQGEGTMGPKVHFRGVRFFALPFLAKHYWKKPVVSLNQSFYAARPDDLRVAANIYRHFDVIALREAQSYALYRSLDIGQALLCPDLAFRVRCKSGHENPLSAEGPYFCATGSAAMDEYDLDSYITLITTVARQTNLRPVLLYSKQDDDRLLSAMARALPPTDYVVVNSRSISSYVKVLPILRDARFIIGGRYHAAVTALAQGTPVILLPANTHKNEGLGPLLGLHLPVYSTSDHAAIYTEVGNILRSRDAYTGKIRQALHGIDLRFATFGNYLRRFIANGYEDSDRTSRDADLTVLTSDHQLTAVANGNAAIYAHVNVGRSYDLIGRWRSMRKQLGAWHLVKSQLKARNLRKLKPYVSMALNHRIYDPVPHTFFTEWSASKESADDSMIEPVSWLSDASAHDAGTATAVEGL